MLSNIASHISWRRCYLNCWRSIILRKWKQFGFLPKDVQCYLRNIRVIKKIYIRILNAKACPRDIHPHKLCCGTHKIDPLLNGIGLKYHSQDSISTRWIWNCPLLVIQTLCGRDNYLWNPCINYKRLFLSNLSFSA